MSTTLVGLFDTHAEAQEACRKLEAVDVDERVEAWRASGYAPPVTAETFGDPARRSEADIEEMAGPPQGARESTQRPYTGVERRFHRAPYAHDERRAAGW